jgi:bleomycin hydrolase
VSRPLDPASVEQLAKELDADPAYRLARNAVTTTPVDQVALDREVVAGVDHSMSHLLDDWAATDQKKSGRCWLFAGTNLLRVGAAERLGVKDFQFSQAHLLFWDKLEKANHWLESILATADRDADDRTVAHLLTTPAEDGGQWNMFAALVRKHGLVPQRAMPETQSSSDTGAMNRNLSRLLRRAARDLRALRADGADDAALQAAKEETLRSVHRLLAVHLGTPPQSLTWQWRDTEREFHHEGEMTPQQFAERYVGVDLDEYVCLVHDPRPTSELGRTYTVEHLGNVVGAPPVVYLNADIDLLRRLTMESVLAGEPVWFGCDTDRMSSVALGVWDAVLYDYAVVYGPGAVLDGLDKAERLMHQDTLMTHAMLFTGVNVVDGVPTRWRVENSWGEEKAQKGFWTMHDSWFGEHVFEVAVRRSLLPPELVGALEQTPIVLPAWDPMGALAR